MIVSLETEQLINRQLKEWELAGVNYAGLGNVKTKTITLDGGSEIKIQFNPARIRSSSAKVDAKSIQERACFLCETNRPAEQDGVAYDNYTVLINPFPIFQKHLTIPHNQHIDQSIKPHFKTMLELAGELPGFIVFYNGPKCGASAPDHFHFQAGNKGFMPVEDDWKTNRFKQFAGEKTGVRLYNWRGYSRGVITLSGINIDALMSTFNKLHDLLHQRQIGEVEPMLNILAYRDDEEYVVHIYPRIKHRPDCYFNEGDDQLLISPASVDMGGVFITPREVDFEKITEEHIHQILKQVCMSEDECAAILNKLLA